MTCQLSTQAVDPMPNLEIFSDIMRELMDKRTTDGAIFQSQRYALKFVNRSLRSYENTKSILLDYLKSNLPDAECRTLVDRIKDYNTESCICELILVFIDLIEANLDTHIKLMADILEVVNKVKQMSASEGEFKEDVIMKCSLVVYDSFGVLRSMRKQVLDLTRTYHVPMYYDTEERCFRIRSSLLTTYKNLLTVMSDFATLADVFWIIRHKDQALQRTATFSEFRTEETNPAAADRGGPSLTASNSASLASEPSFSVATGNHGHQTPISTNSSY